jgi:hypothetical protein
VKKITAFALVLALIITAATPVKTEADVGHDVLIGAAISAGVGALVVLIQFMANSKAINSSDDSEGLPVSEPESDQVNPAPAAAADSSQTQTVP